MLTFTTISPITNSLFPTCLCRAHWPLPTHKQTHTHTHTHSLCHSPNPQSLPVSRSWSDTENFYSNDRSILTLSPMEATHCWLPGPLTATLRARPWSITTLHPPSPHHYFINLHELQVSALSAGFGEELWDQRMRLCAAGYIVLHTSESILSRKAVKDVSWELQCGRKWNMNCRASQCGVSPTSVELLYGTILSASEQQQFIKRIILVLCTLLKATQRCVSSQCLHSEISPATQAHMKLFFFHFHSVATFFMRLLKWPL